MPAMTTSSAVPASTPLSVRYVSEHAEQRGEGDCDAQPFRRQLPSACSSMTRRRRLRPQRTSSVIHSGRWRDVRQHGERQTAMHPDELLPERRQRRQIEPEAAHRGLEQRQRRQAALAMRRPDVRRDRARRAACSPKALPGRVRILDPAAQLRQARLDVESGQAVPVEAVRSDRRARVHLDLQALLARVRLPGDASRRVAGMKGRRPAKSSSPRRESCAPPVSVSTRWRRQSARRSGAGRRCSAGSCAGKPTRETVRTDGA